jgi:hypothetical protein
VPKETTSVRRNWSRWRGTLEDVVGVAQRVEEILLEVGVSDPNASMTVKRSTGETTFDSADEAAATMPKVSLDGLKQISIGGGFGALDGVRLRVTIVFTTDGGVGLYVEGQDAGSVMAAGICDDLGAIIARGDRSLRQERALLVALLALWLVVTTGWIASRVLDGPDTVTAGLAVASCVTGAAQWWTSIIRPWLIPRLEITNLGEPTRSERLGQPLLKLLATAATLILGGLIGVFFDRHL